MSAYAVRAFSYCDPATMPTATLDRSPFSHQQDNKQYRYFQTLSTPYPLFLYPITCSYLFTS